MSWPWFGVMLRARPLRSADWTKRRLVLSEQVAPFRALAIASACCVGAAAMHALPAAAERIENQVAVFSALDKVTARISRLEVPLDQTVRFGSLKVTPRVCYSRPPTDQPKTTSFVEVEEVLLDGKEKRIFAGWMFAESPGLNAVEHPVFDVWLTDCTGPRGIAQKGLPQRPGPEAVPRPDGDGELARRRVRR